MMIPREGEVVNASLNLWVKTRFRPDKQEWDCIKAGGNRALLFKELTTQHTRANCNCEGLSNSKDSDRTQFIQLVFIQRLMGF